MLCYFKSVRVQKRKAQDGVVYNRTCNNRSKFEIN